MLTAGCCMYLCACGGGSPLAQRQFYLLQAAEAEVEPRLSVERARLCVDSLRQHFADRVANLQSLWQRWEQRLDASRQTTQRWTQTMTDSNKVPGLLHYSLLLLLFHKSKRCFGLMINVLFYQGFNYFN